MDNLPQIFNYHGKEVRTVIVNNEPWWVAKDVCEVLGLEQVTRAMSRLDEDERGLVKVTHPQNASKSMSVNAVNEAGLYQLIMASNKFEAKEFKRWITREVLPSIRKHGAYMTPEVIEQVIYNPDVIIGIASRLKAETARADEAEREKRALEAQRETDRPKLLFVEALEVSRDSILVGELAKLLKQNGIAIGETRLFEWMREHGYLIKSGSERNMPTQRSMDLKIMEVKLGQRNSISEGVKLTKTPKITGKGQIYFINKFKEMYQGKGA